MAAGSYFAEFDLDYTKFDRNTKKLDAVATSTIVNIEKHWDHLTDSQIQEYGEAAAYIVKKHAEILADTKYTSREQARAYTEAVALMKRVNADMAYEAEKTAKANQQNADLRLAQMRAEADAVRDFQAAMGKQKKEEASATEKANKDNADYHNSKRKYEQDTQKEVQGIIDAQYRDSVAANEKQNRDNADYHNSKRKYEQDTQKEVQALIDKQFKDQEAANDARNKDNAEWWMAKRKYDADLKKSESANYDTLGIKSKAHYEQRKADAANAYKSIMSTAAATGENEYRIKKAYNEKLKALDAEYAGQHSTSMAGMVRGALAVYAAYYVVSQVVGTVVNFLKSGLEVADQMKTSAIAVAASITTAQGSPENYRKNYEYASALVLKLREVDKVSFATYENILLMNRAMELQGVHLDMNNQKQMSVFTSLTNAVALYTSGQDQAKQAAQEFRSIFSGNIKAGSEVAKIIDTQAKASGKYANGLKDILKHSHGHKDVLEKIQPFLIGIEASVRDISKTWESATTTLKSSWDRFKMTAAEALFPNAAQDIKDLASAIDYLTPKLFGLWEDTRSGVGEDILGVAALIQSANAMAFKAFEDAKNRPMYDLTIKQIKKIEEMQIANERRSLDFKMKMEGFTPAPKDANLFDYTELKKVESVYGGIYNYVKGIRETPETGPGADQIAENLRSQTVNLAKRKEAAKDAYEEAIRHADQEEKLRRKQGVWELDNIATTLKAKTNAAGAYQTKLMGFADTETSIEQKKAEAAEQDFNASITRAEKQAAIDSEMKRAETGRNDDYANKKEAAEQKMVSSASQAAQEISKYSKAATDAKIADINREYDARATTTNKILNEQARALALSRVGPEQSKSQTDERLSILGVVAPDSDQVMAAFMENIQAQADLISDQFESQAEKEAWMTSKIEEEWRKRHEAASGYYSGIEGYSEEAYNKAIAVIKATQKADKDKYGAESANKKAIQATQKAAEARFDAEHADILKVTGATAEMFGNAKALMNENSNAYKIAHNAEMALRALEIGIQVEKNLMLGVGAVLAQGATPITGFAQMAAMASAVAGILAIVGIGFTAFGGEGGDVPNPNQYASGSGSLMGSDDASNSIGNVADILKDSHASEYARLTGIYQEVQSLNDNITGLVRGLVFGGEGSSTLATVGSQSLLGSFTSKSGDFVGGFADDMMKVNPILGGIIKSISDLTGKAIDGIFGGDKSTSQVGGGIRVSGTTMGDVLSGASDAIGQFFRDMKEVTDGGWFHSDDTRFWSTFSALDADTNRLLTQVFSNLGSTVLEIANGFGVDVTSQLENYAINIGKIDLMGKSADEISEELTGIFSKYGDKLVQDLFGNIVSQYQKINEGMLETAVRLLNDQAQVEEIFKMTRITADASFSLSESLVKLAGGLDTLKEAATSYYEAFFDDAEKASDRQNSLTESLSQLGYILPGTRQGFRDLVESTKAMTGANQESYVSLLNMASTADAYYTYVEEKQDEILSSFKSQLSSVQDALKSFTTQTSESVVASIDDIIRRTRAGIVVPDGELSSALSAATSTDTSGFGSGLAYDLNRARNAAALRELESVTAAWVSADEAQVALLEQQAVTMNTLTALTAQTTTALTGESGTASLLLEVKELKGLLTGNAVYVKRISDNVEEMAN